MFMTRWRPSGLNPFWRELDDHFRVEGNGRQAGYCPAVDISEEQDHFLITADLPGMSEKEIEVKVESGVLLLSGKREDTREKQGEGQYYRERRLGAFCRQFRLGEGVNPSAIEASYKNGVLAVKLPKKEESKPRQIPVSTN